MQYKGYVGSVEFSEADGLFFGKVLGIRALISYEGTSAAELVADFHGADTENLSEKQTIGFGEFNASNIPLILHCIVQINPSFL